MSGAAFVRNELKKMGPWSPLERRAVLLMGAATALWMTDFLHHISPAMIGLGAGLARSPTRNRGARCRRYKEGERFASVLCGHSTQFGSSTDGHGGDWSAYNGDVCRDYWPITGLPSLALVSDLRLPFSTTSFWGASFNVEHVASGFDELRYSSRIQSLGPGNDLDIRGRKQNLCISVFGYLYREDFYGFFDGRDLLRFGACMAIIESVVILLLVSLCLAAHWAWVSRGIQDSRLAGD